MTDHRDVVVIGAGISGLACAHRLKTHGFRVAVIEQSERAGGVMRSEVIDGYLVERGPNSMQGTEEVLALVEELGIANEMLAGDPKAPALIYFNKRLHPVPNSPPALVKTELLSARGKLRLLGEPFSGKRPTDGEESVAAFFTRRLGREVADRLVAPFVSGIYAGDANRLSMRAAFPRLAELEAQHGSLIRGGLAQARAAKKARQLGQSRPKRKTIRSVSFRRGLQSLPDALAAQLGEDLLTNCSDCEIRTADQTWHNPQSTIRNPQSGGYVVSFNRSGAPAHFTCGRVVIATPARAAALLVAPYSPEASRLLQEVEYPPLTVLSLAYDKAAIRDSLYGFGFLAAPDEGLRTLGCLYSSSLFPGRAPAGKALLTTFIGGARNPDAARLDDAELAATVHNELRGILGILSEPRVIAITRWERAIPQYNLGHVERVRRIEGLLREQAGIALTGNYLHGVSVGDCIKEANRTARGLSASGQPS
ncbi:MAG TPA: protoporphyrinogen oxidase [Blastocatellia bacterium]|nr:protoporphyrinogen oxidase [Blastocatellia bacterium]